MLSLFLTVVFCIVFSPVLKSNEVAEGVIKEAKKSAKDFGKDEVKKCKTLSNEERMLAAANYTGRSEELNSVIQVLNEDLTEAKQKNDQKTVLVLENNIKKFMRRTVVYLYFMGVYRDDCRTDIIEEDMGQGFE